MQTKKLYYENSYIKDFIAEVLSCEESDNKYKVILDKTAFFPEGGGQKPDLGSIGDAVVTYVQEVDGTVFHFLNKPLNIGEFYDCSIDWDIRFRRMQEHSGEHIVSGIVHGIYGYENVGFHMDEDYVTVDFNGELNREQLDDIEERANKAVYADYDIKCWFPDEKELNFLNYRSKLELTENVRLVEIENTDLCACCAPHLKRTGEVGIIKILDFMRHRGGVRIVIKSGLDALRDYRKKYKSVYDVSGLLSAKQDEIASSVERVQGELDCVKRDFYNFKIGVAQNDKENITTYTMEIFRPYNPSNTVTRMTIYPNGDTALAYPTYLDNKEGTIFQYDVETGELVTGWNGRPATGWSSNVKNYKTYSLNSKDCKTYIYC